MFRMARGPEEFCASLQHQIEPKRMIGTAGGTIQQRSPPDSKAIRLDPLIAPVHSSVPRALPLGPTLPHRKPIPLPPQMLNISEVRLNPQIRWPAVPLRVGMYVNENLKVLAELATSPGLPSLTLLSPKLPWAITAHASEGWVTVGDILAAVRRMLETRMSEAETAEWITSRTRDGPLFGGNRIREVTRRILLDGKDRFGGLSESTMGCDIWLVHFV
ncbi:hypothetical protein R3P38DRAFT_3083488 [Favolaschia claudopus]|uniref:DUF6699 domain-containing protein n=1 Tax=Favolaschia claudopus TaxID=2862362 RepID=A0AAV9ZUL0_9AGAR